MFDNLKAVEGVEQEKDVTSNRVPLESGIYPAIIKLAYTGKSKGGAMSVTIHAEVEGKMHRETLWVTSGDAKGNLPFYTKQDGSKAYLPGYNVFEAISQLAADKPASALSAEPKMVKLYSFEERKETLQQVDVIAELLDKPVYLGLLKVIEDKTENDGAGNYVPTGETRELNQIDKVFRASDRMTVTEAKANAESPDFYNRWDASNTGNTRDKSTKDAGKSGAPTMTATVTAAAAPATKTLFGG
jgi:hypothetical protein